MIKHTNENCPAMYKAAATCICNSSKELHPDMDEHYEVWVMLERWRGNDKLEEKEK